MNNKQKKEFIQKELYYCLVKKLFDEMLYFIN
jgi:hypothetical protein